jgi:predicted Zn-dependent protease
VGETTRAEALLEQDLEANPTATIWQQVRAPQIRAAIALAQAKPADAVEALKVAQSWDMRSFDLPALRGRAYLANKQPLLAEYEFLSILDHPGVEPLSQNYALAQLGLARALAQQGKSAKAAFAYRTFLQNWAGADADVPRLKEAKQEYAKLPKEAVGGAN